MGLCIGLLYGVDCGTCPQTGVPECQRAKKIDGACTNVALGDNVECDLPDGTDGWCQEGNCVRTDLCRPNQCNDSNDCTANLCDPVTGQCSYAAYQVSFVPCNNGGVCAEEQCIEGDPCLRAYVGRIDCCDAQYCVDFGLGDWASTCPVPMADGTPCDPDPLSLVPPGLANPPDAYEGHCSSGECVWNDTTGAGVCGDLHCIVGNPDEEIDPLLPIEPDGDCTRNWCDPTLGCQSYPIGEARPCGGNWDGNCLGNKCDSTNSCNESDGYTPCCPGDHCANEEHPICKSDFFAGSTCDVTVGDDQDNDGKCSLIPVTPSPPEPPLAAFPDGPFVARCVPAACATPDPDRPGNYLGCDDSNDCTIDSCDEASGECQYAVAPYFTPCNRGLGACSGRSTYCYMPPIPCTEQGLIDAIAVGGGPHTFACTVPATITLTDTLVIDTDVILDGGGLVTIDGNYLHRLVDVNAGVTAELRGMTLTRGRDTVDQGEGGIVNSGTLSLTDVQVTDCQGLPSGGAPVLNWGTMTLTRCSFTGNDAVHGPGALSNGGGGTLTVTDSVFDGNSSDTGLISQGGAIGNFGTATITGTTISNNSAQDEGGGIYNTGALNIWGSIISDNASGSDGGGVYDEGTGSLTIAGSTISGNNAASDGGGIAARGDLRVVSSALFQNLAGGFGGGVDANGGSVMFINSTFGDNHAEIGGGAYVAGAAFTAISTTISGNTSSAPLNTDAMGILGAAAFQNTIITGGCGSLASGSVVTAGGNIQYPGSECFVPGPTDQEVTDALLSPLQANGTFVPLAGSPAINAVGVAACVDDLGAPLSFDQVGTPRPQLVHCDSGAVEAPCGGCPPSGLECEAFTCNQPLQVCELGPLTDGSPCSFGQCVAGVCEQLP